MAWVRCQPASASGPLNPASTTASATRGTKRAVAGTSRRQREKVASRVRSSGGSSITGN